MMAFPQTPGLLKKVSRIRKRLSCGLLLFSLCSPVILPAQSTSTVPKQSELQAIVQRHEKLLFQYSEDPEKYERKNINQRIENIANAYASFNQNNPKDVFGYVLHGKFLREIGRHTQAYKVFQQAYDLDPNLAIVNQQLGNHNAENGRFREAYQHYSKAVKLDPSVAEYHYQLGDHLINFSKPILSEDVLSAESFDRIVETSLAEAVRLDPENRSYQKLQALSYHYLNKPQWSNALEAWTKLLKPGISEDETQGIQLQRAKALHELGRAPEARLLLSEVTRPAHSVQKQSLLAVIEGKFSPTISDTSTSDIKLPTNISTTAVDQNSLQEIAELRKQLNDLKSNPPSALLP
jgi:tetratricopeptide (TPR) repeat protein